MNYELAKKLKEAGFPLDYKELSYEYSGHVPHVNGPAINGVFDSIPIPSLSELIEECNGIISSLNVNDEQCGGVIKGGWTAYSFSGEKGDGKNPEEAVANLWLQLNKK